MRDQNDVLVEHLAVKHRAKAALRALMVAGSAATPALRRGLSHDDPAVRIGCCVVLDHHLDEAAVPELMANLSHDHDEVRAQALHALACDRCKEGSCRPAEREVVPIVISMLENDRSPTVRYFAAGLLGEIVHRNPLAVSALEAAARQDPHPMVRKKASWFVPGGPRYERTRPKAPRTQRPQR